MRPDERDAAIFFDNPKDEVGSFDPPPPAERKPHTFAIPPSAPRVPCRSCGATVVWVMTAAGKRMPVDVDTGASHFSTCPHAKDWRKPR